MKNLAVLGSTGSIGTMTLEVVKALGTYRVVALAANSNISLLKKQVSEFNPKHIVIYNQKAGEKFFREEKHFIKKYKLTVHLGIEGLINIASLPKLDLVFVAVVGAIGLLPIFAALDAGHSIAIANKEPLVIAGKLVMQKAHKNRIQILPVDSEHSAIFQCLLGENGLSVNELILTASGGPFYKHSTRALRNVSVEDTLKHPRWKMGKKITVDSATLMNKGLEVIEAHHLYC